MKLRTLLILPLVLAACTPPGADETEQPEQPRRSVIVQRVRPQPLDVAIKLPVRIRPKDVIELRAPVGGFIRDFDFEKGDRIPASSLPPAGWLELEEYLASFPEEATPGDEQVALRNLRHLEGVQCFARIEAAQLLEGLWDAQISYDQAVRDLRRARDYPESTGAQLDQARTRRSSARAQVSRVMAMIHETYICNPAAGVLTEKLRQQGEYVNAGELIARVAIMHPLVAELEIPQAHRSAISVGDEIKVEIGSLTDDAGDRKIRTARVALIDSVAHPATHSFTVELHIDNPDFELPAGILGTVHVTVYSRPAALVVPLSALKLDGTRRSLFVVTEGDPATVREVSDVQIGHYRQDWVEIRGSGLGEGALVVTFGAQALTDGDPVTWTETDPYLLPETKGGAR